MVAYQIKIQKLEDFVFKMKNVVVESKKEQRQQN